VIKAVGSKAGEVAEPSAPKLHASGGLVPILLDARKTDHQDYKHQGFWVAVPPANLKVLQQ
jgi:hypothetical protein